MNRPSTLAPPEHPSSPDLAPVALAAPADPTGLVDWAMLDHLLDMIRKSQIHPLTLVLDLFSHTLSAQITEIAAAVLVDDRAQIRMLAHRLRGGSQQLGAVHLAGRWAALEAAALGADPLAELLEQARNSYAQTLAQLTARLESPGA